MAFLYNFAVALAVIISAPWWTFKIAIKGKYRAGLGERLGRVPVRIRGAASKGEKTNCIWIHAVSVGEVLAIAGMLRELRDALPHHRIVVSTTTESGQKLARERFGSENVFYFPLDFGIAIAPWLRALHPELIVLAETEFWPNFLRLAKRSGARVAVVNARISDRSLPGYLRWRRWMRGILQNVDLFLAQSDEDARRLNAIGAPAARVQVSGNLKFKIAAPANQPIAARLKTALQSGRAMPVIVAGSTVAGEEPYLLTAFKEILKGFPRAVLILAPRRPERFDEVAALCAHALPLHRRSRWHDENLSGSIFLLNSIGELASLYSLATVAFVGGSLIAAGGHNILEPASFGVPIVVGPHTENFRDIIAAFEREQAIMISNANHFTRDLLQLLQDSQQRERLARAARKVLTQNQGATQLTCDQLLSLLAHVGEAPVAAAVEPAP